MLYLSPQPNHNVAQALRHCGRLALLCLLLAVANTGWAQRNIAERSITLSMQQVSVEKALAKIAEQGNFRFSYNADLIPVDSIVSINAHKQTVGKLVQELFAGSIVPRVVGQHMILKPAPKKAKEQSEKVFVVRGTIKHARTGKPIRNASVFADNRKFATLTDADGNYELTIETEQKYTGISVSRRSFLDTVVVIRPAEQELNVLLLPVPENLQKVPTREFSGEEIEPEPIRTVEELAIVKFMVPERQRLLNLNFDDFLTEIPAQISLVPNLGTNRLVSGSVENNFSLNVLAGYSYAVKGLEVGGLVNVTRTNMRGFQVAGFGNVVGGKVRGVQAAGFFNNCRGSLHGAQVAGFTNIALDTMRGVQVAGFSNIMHGYMEGGQVAGFTNIASKDVDGFQVAGFYNEARGDVNVGQIAGFLNRGNNIGGAQIAGFMNLAKGDVDGAQAAGYINSAKNVNAAQVAGFLNHASGEVKGVQIAGFMNIAKKVGGGQIGIFNFADSVGGITLGLFSFVRKGYHEFELSNNEMMPAEFAFKTGTRYLYNIFSFGTDSYQPDAFASFGYGFGTELWFNSERFRANIDVTTHQLRRSWQTMPDLELLNRVKFAGGWRLGKALVINTGPVFSVFVTKNKDSDTGEFIDAAPYKPLFTASNDINYVSAWIGWHAGLRL